MLKFLIQFIIFSLLLTFSSYSNNYKKIIINGNERISDDTIVVFSEIAENQSLDENSINDILKRFIRNP